MHFVYKITKITRNFHYITHMDLTLPLGPTSATLVSNDALISSSVSSISGFKKFWDMVLLLDASMVEWYFLKYACIFEKSQTIAGSMKGHP